MKIPHILYFYLAFLVVTSTACVADSGSIQANSAGVPTQFAPDSEVDVTGTVTADELYLRDAPEELGGSVITSIPNGSGFDVTGCVIVTSSGTSWAYGSYTDPDGIVWIGWAASRYISGVCK